MELVADAMSLYVPPTVSALCHWYEVVILDPVTDPGTAVSCDPTRAVPVIEAEAKVGFTSDIYAPV